MKQSHIQRHNHFDFIRFIAASMVIIGHGQALTGRPDIGAMLP